jgi:hypothetical protein
MPISGMSSLPVIRSNAYTGDTVKEDMRITALVPTHHLPEESMAWITDARNVFDEVIVLIDQKRATPGTVARAEKVATKVVRNNRDIWYDPDRFLHACRVQQ